MSAAPKRDSYIDVGRNGPKKSKQQIVGYNLFSTGRGVARVEPVLAELVIDHALLHELVGRTNRGKDRVLTVGPFTIRVWRESPLIVTANMYVDGESV